MKLSEKRKNGPQVYDDPWRSKRRTFRYTGDCLACGRRTFGFDDGENDPRGYLGDNTVSILCSHDDDRIGGEWPLCSLCANTEEKYRAGVRAALERTAYAPNFRISRDRPAENLPTIRSWLVPTEESTPESGPTGLVSDMLHCGDCTDPKWKKRHVDLPRHSEGGEPVYCCACHEFVGYAGGGEP